MENLIDMYKLLSTPVNQALSNEEKAGIILDKLDPLAFVNWQYAKGCIDSIVRGLEEIERQEFTQ